MRKILALAVVALFAVFANNHANADTLQSPSCEAGCCNVSECDSIDIPVFIVDGVEVQNLDGIAPEDVLSVSVVKTPEVMKLFRPRVGGVVIIETKSKKFLKPIVERYNKMTDEQKKNRIPGQLLIR